MAPLSAEDAPPEPRSAVVFSLAVLVFGLALLVVGADRALVRPFAAVAETCCPRGDDVRPVES